MERRRRGWAELRPWRAGLWKRRRWITRSMKTELREWRCELWKWRRWWGWGKIRNRKAELVGRGSRLWKRRRRRR